MADKVQQSILEQGAHAWYEWQQKNPEEKIDLSKADLSKADLRETWLCGADLTEANLAGADLTEAQLMGAWLNGANLVGACLIEADLSGAVLTGVNLKDAKLCGADLKGATFYNAVLGSANLIQADLSGANLAFSNLADALLVRADLSGAYLDGANLTGADLSGATLVGTNLVNVNLSRATMVDTNLTQAIMNGCHIYGVSAWNLQLEGAQQSNLLITPDFEPMITVDNLEVAQFVYLMLTNPKIRDIIDTIGKKAVLILGRFTPNRKKVLDALRQKLRELGYVPIMFDFEGARSKDFTETIMVLAGMSRFIIADITMPKSSPMELAVTVPNYMVPFVPIILDGEEPFSLFRNLQNKYDWVLDLLEYKDSEQLTAAIEQEIVQPALRKENELLLRKAKEFRKRHA